MRGYAGSEQIFSLITRHSRRILPVAGRYDLRGNMSPATIKCRGLVIKTPVDLTGHVACVFRQSSVLKKTPLLKKPVEDRCVRMICGKYRV